MLRVSVLASTVVLLFGSAYTQESSSTFKCPAASFYVDPEDCRNFYRCYLPPGRNCAGRCPKSTPEVKQEQVPYMQAKFSCGEGTIFDEKRATCNYPEDVDPGQKCVKVNENADDLTSALCPETMFHYCFGVNDYKYVSCIKDMGGVEYIFAANEGKKKAISFSVVEVGYKCGNPRDIIRRNPLGGYRVEPGNATNFVSRAVSNGICRKHIFYNCRTNGNPANCTNPPFYIQFAFELAEEQAETEPGH